MVGHLIDDVKLLDRELVDLVHNVEAWHILAIVVHHVNELIDVIISPQHDVSARNTKLLEDPRALVPAQTLRLLY